MTALLKVFLCGLALLAVPLSAPKGTRAAEEAPRTAAQLIGKREKLRQEELARREKDEAEKWAKEKKEGVMFAKTIKKSGEIDKRIDVAIFAEGFQRDNMVAFSEDASRVATQLLRIYPYGDYRDFFNFHVVGIASKESGVSTAKNKKDTAFGALLDDDILTANLSNLQKYADVPPDMDLGIVLVNTSNPRARSTASGPFVTLRMGGDLNTTVGHELGHAFGGLADEYEVFNGAPSEPEEPREVNVTVEKDPRKVKWHYWIEAMPGQVGVLEGARLYGKGYYRPERSCLMRCDNNRFCHVCLEEMIRNIYENVPPIDIALPLGYEVKVSQGEKEKFSVHANGASSGPVVLEWFVDGVSRGKGAEAFLLNCGELKPGDHEVMVRAIVENPNVLRDKGVLESSRFWKVKVAAGNMPTFNGPYRPLTVNVDEQLKYAVQAKPGTAGKELAFKIDHGPEGLQIDGKSGEMTWTPKKTQAGAHLVTVTADDGAQKASNTLVIGVIDKETRNTMAVIDYIPIPDVKKGELIEFVVKATDLEGNKVVYDVNNEPPGATLDRETGKFRWRPDFSQVGQFDLEFQAFDGQATDKYRVPVIVRDEHFTASDIAAAQKDIAGGNRDAFARVFYALRAKNASIRRQGINMLKTEGAKSSILEMYRLMRDKDAQTAATAGDALLATVKDKLAPDDNAYYFLLLADIYRTAAQMEDDKDTLVKLQAVLDAMNQKAADIRVKRAAADAFQKINKIGNLTTKPGT
jgi:hypothetical protein